MDAECYDALTKWLNYTRVREERARALREFSRDLLDRHNKILPVFICGCCPDKTYFFKGSNVASVLKVLKSMDREELDSIDASRTMSKRTKQFDAWQIYCYRPKKCFHKRMCDVANGTVDGPVPPVTVIKKEYPEKPPKKARREPYLLRPRRQQ